ncbi:MAG: hypothetical protein ACJZ8V_06060 [Paracoccaceae bacterium]
MYCLANRCQSHRGIGDGFCPLRGRVYSGGLKSILGSWLCQGFGFVTWHPPVKSGLGNDKPFTIAIRCTTPVCGPVT